MIAAIKLLIKTVTIVPLMIDMIKKIIAAYNIYKAKKEIEKEIVEVKKTKDTSALEKYFK